MENLAEKCDFSKCTVPDKSKLNVHLVPHTHDDVGWLKTVDQYYYGMRNDIQRGGVQYILDTVVEELIRDKERRFIYVETAFFWKWWQEQNEEQRAVVRELINTGQYNRDWFGKYILFYAHKLVCLNILFRSAGVYQWWLVYER